MSDEPARFASEEEDALLARLADAVGPVPGRVIGSAKALFREATGAACAGEAAATAGEGARDEVPPDA